MAGVGLPASCLHPASPVVSTSALEATRDLVLIVSTIVGILVAINGVNAWKRQLRGREAFDAARRLLRATYEYAEYRTYLAPQ